MEKLIRKIKYSKNKNLNNLSYLLNTEKTICIFGAGGYAYTLIDELRKLSIFPECCVVDDEYYKEGILCNSISVVSINEFNEKYADSICLVGFGIKYKDQEKELRRLRGLITGSIEIIDFEDQYLEYFEYLNYDFIMKHQKEFESLYESLADDLSRNILVEYLNGKVSGDMHRLGQLRTDDVHDYELEMVFSERKTGVIIDCGAYDGKSALQMSEYAPDSKIYALEFDEDNYSLLKKNTDGVENVLPIKKGVWSSDGTICIDGEGQSTTINDSPNTVSGKKRVDVTTIDNLVHGERVAAIFMDIEGSELNALVGAESTISSFRPKLAIRVYHKHDDLITIPQYLMNKYADNNYKYYLRYNCMYRGAADLTLYAI